MNIGNILKVADAIENSTIPDLGFNMGEGVARTDEFNPDLSGNHCGTVACIAGWSRAVQLSRIPRFKEECANWDGIKGDARKFLGLDRKTANELFEPDGEVAFDDRITPAHAINALRTLAITGKVDWAGSMKSNEPAMPSLPSPLPAKRERV